MTLKESKLFYSGKDYWGEYVRVNGYAFKPSLAGIRKISRLLDLSQKHLTTAINFYLEA